MLSLFNFALPSLYYLNNIKVPVIAIVVEENPKLYSTGPKGSCVVVYRNQTTFVFIINARL